MHRLWPAMAGLLCLLALTSIGAQADERIDALGVPHAGQMKIAGPFHLELVVDPHELTLYINDQGDAPIPTTGGSAKAIITGGKDRYVVILSPAGENVLKGAGEYKLGSYNLISLMVALPDQELQHVKFVHPKGAKPPPKKAKKGKKSKKAKKTTSKKKPAAQ